MRKILWCIEVRFHLSWMNIYVKYINGKGEIINIIFDSYVNNDTKYHCHRKENLVISNSHQP